jgi:hydroxyacyl-ACP dehydratase HTD2-like protein with hotdog domain
MDIETTQKELHSGKNLALLDDETLKYGKTPIGKAIIKEKKEEEEKPWKKKIECKVCGKTYSRSGSYRHKRTKYHQMYANIEEKIRKIILNV